LRGVELAGAERACAVGRILDWIDAYEKVRFAEKDFISSDVVALLDRKIKAKNHELSSHKGKVLEWVVATSSQQGNHIHSLSYRRQRKVLEWVEAYMQKQEGEAQLVLKELADSDTGAAVAAVLLLLSLAPLSVYQSSYWNNMVNRLGSIDKARCVVFWWSLRTTFRDATNLGDELSWGHQSSQYLASILAQHSG